MEGIEAELVMVLMEENDCASQRPPIFASPSSLVNKILISSLYASSRLQYNDRCPGALNVHSALLVQ